MPVVTDGYFTSIETRVEPTRGEGESSQSIYILFVPYPPVRERAPSQFTYYSFPTLRWVEAMIKRRWIQKSASFAAPLKKRPHLNRSWGPIRGDGRLDRPTVRPQRLWAFKSPSRGEGCITIYPTRYLRQV